MGMEVSFDDSKLQAIAEDTRSLTKTYGDKNAKRIQERLNALRAVDNVLELEPLPGNWHELRSNRSGHWAASLVQPKRIVIRPTPPIPTKDDGGVDWREVRKVTVVEIVDYHSG